MNKKLFRSRNNTMIAGVCGGLGEYLGIDPTFIRIFFVLIALNHSIGVLIYFLLWIIVPRADSRDQTLADSARSGAEEILEHARTITNDLGRSARDPRSQAVLFVGVALILFGAYYLLRSLQLPWLMFLNSDLLWPVLVIIAGLALLYRHWRGE